MQEDALFYTSAIGPIRYLYIIGHDIDHEQTFKMAESKSIPCAFILLSKLKVGENLLDAYQAILQKLLAEKTLISHIQITVHAHGNVWYSKKLLSDTHFIGVTKTSNVDTVDLIDITLKTLMLDSGNSTIHLHSCMGGRVIQDLVKYKTSTDIGLVAHTTNEKVVIGLFSNASMLSGLERNHQPLEGMARTLFDFASDSIIGNDVATSYYLKSKNGIDARGTVRPHQHFTSDLPRYLRLSISNAFEELDKQLREQINIDAIIASMPSTWDERFHIAGLLMAVLHDDKEYIYSYIRAGYNIHKKIGRISAFILAMSQKKMPMVDFLIANGFDPSSRDACDKFLETILPKAIKDGHEDIVHMARFLIENGFDPTSYNTCNDKILESLLPNAIKTGNAGIVKTLLENLQIDPNLPSEPSPLNLALFQGEIDIVRALLDDPRTNLDSLHSENAMEHTTSEIIELLQTRDVQLTTSISKDELSRMRDGTAAVAHGSISSALFKQHQPQPRHR